MDPMEEFYDNPKSCTAYNLQANPIIFDSATVYVKNIQDYTEEALSSVMSDNDRRIKKYFLFPPKKGSSTTVALVTFMTEAEAEDAIYWLNGTPPHRFYLQYAKYSIKDIKNLFNNWWTAECEEAYVKQKKAWTKYHRKPIPQLLDEYKKAKLFFRKVQRASIRKYHEKSVPKNVECKEEPESDELEAGVKNQEANEKSCNSNGFAFSSSPSLEEIRQEVAKFAEERNWNMYHQPRNLLLALVGEVGELSELFQWKGEVQPGLPGWTEKEKQHLGEELSDVLIYLIRLSDKCHINLPSAVMKKVALNAQKYPASKVYGSSKKYNEYEDGSK